METTNIPLWGWVVFGALTLIMLLIDLYAHRGEHGKTRKAAGIWTAIWIGLGLGFCGFVWVVFGANEGQEYLATYLIEKSLSLDNLFVFLIIFQSLNIPREHQHEVLFWGIFGALVFRAIFIFAGAAAIEQYSWVPYVFGALLLIAAWRTWMEDPTEESENRVVEWLSRHLPLSHHAHDGKFIAYENGRRVFTSLAVALVAIELTDIMFAIDSVAAALSMTTHRFVLYSANVFAILGLRALYLFLSHMIEDLKYLHYGLALVLGFAGVKLIADHWIEEHIPETTAIFVSIGFIIVTIGASVWASLRYAGDFERPGGGNGQNEREAEEKKAVAK